MRGQALNYFENPLVLQCTEAPGSPGRDTVHLGLKKSDCADRKTKTRSGRGGGTAFQAVVPDLPTPRFFMLFMPFMVKKTTAASPDSKVNRGRDAYATTRTRAISRKRLKILGVAGKGDSADPVGQGESILPGVNQAASLRTECFSRRAWRTAVSLPGPAQRG